MTTRGLTVDRPDRRRLEETATTAARAWVGRWGLDGLLVVVLLLVSTVTLLWLIREPNFVDDADYFEYASWLLEGEPGRPRIANLYRLGFIGVVVASQAVFGYTPTSYYVVSIGFSAGVIAALYVFSRTLQLSRLVALSGSLLLLTSPVFLEYATILRIDWPAVFWILLGLSALVVGARSETRYRTRFLMGVAAGTFLFLALWTKEGSVPLVAASPLVVWAVRRDRHMWRIVAVAACTGALLLGGELLLLALLYGDPLARLDTILGAHVTGAATRWVEVGLVSGRLTWVDLALRYPRLLLETTYGAIFVAAVLVGMVVAFLARRRALFILGLLGVVATAFISLAVVSMDPLVPLLRTKARYLSLGFVFFLPLLASSALVVSEAVVRRLAIAPGARSARRLASAGLIVLLVPLLAIGLREAEDDWYRVKNGADAMFQSRRAVLALLADEDRPLRRILTGRMTERVLEMYLPREARDMLMALDFNTSPPRFDFRDPDDFHPGDLVVLNLSRLQNNARYGFYEDGVLPGFLLEPPIHWVEMGRTAWRTFRIYYVQPPDDWETDQLPEPSGGFEARFHAYPFEPGDGVVEQPTEEPSFVLRDAEDVRIVLGAGRYHLPPSADGRDAALHLEGGSFVVELIVRAEEEVELDWVTAWIFDGEANEPRAHPLTEIEREGDRIAYVGRPEVDARGGSFRVMIRASGNGRITVEDLRVSRVEDFLSRVSAGGSSMPVRWTSRLRCPDGPVDEPSGCATGSEPT